MSITIFTLIVLLFSVVIHEVAHGSVALYLGDSTAKYAGRLTLNPLKHLDPLGTIMLLVVGFGWAKPVPINPFNFRDKKWGPLKVAIAGPAVNFLIAILFGLAIRFINLSSIQENLFGTISGYNFILGIFNLIPIPPLDGSHILFSFLPDTFAKFKFLFYQYGSLILILFIFLGGSKFLFLGANFLFYFVTGQSLGI